jgi:hypothetical protein
MLDNNKTKITNKMSKRKAAEMGADVEDTVEIKKKRVGIENLVFLFFTAASCGLCQGCDLCHPEVCAPKEANAIEKDGMIYKQIGRDFKRAFASLTCLFIRMRANFKYYTTPTATPDHNGRSIVAITDDSGKPMGSQALKFACLAWGKLTPAAKLATADMPLRDFGSAHPVDHTGNNKTINIVSKGMIMTLPEHKAKTRLSEAQIANQAMSLSAPCTMTVFVSKGEPLLDSERNPIVENYDHRKEVMIEYKLKSSQIVHSIAREDTTWNSLVKIKYNGQDCLAQFSWYDVPDLEGEIWKPVTKDDHKFLGCNKMSEIFDCFVSNMSRFKSVTKSTQNARIRDYRGQERPRFKLIKKKHTFSRVVALVFHRKAMYKYILKQYLKTGKLWTFATLQVDHIDFNPKNHCANNLQFLTPQENNERSNNRPCRIWEKGKKDAKKYYPSVTAAADDIGYEDSSSVYDIIKNNTHKKWRGEYIVAST